MVKTFLFYKEEPIVKGNRPDVTYYFETENKKFGASHHDISEFIRYCKSLKSSGLEIQIGDIVTTLPAPQVKVPKQGEKARYFQVPLTNEELAGLYHRIFELS